MPKSVHQVEECLEKERIYCVASGEVEGVIKLYGYAKTDISSHFFLELEITRKTKDHIKGRVSARVSNEVDYNANWLEVCKKTPGRGQPWPITRFYIYIYIHTDQV